MRKKTLKGTMNSVAVLATTYSTGVKTIAKTTTLAMAVLAWMKHVSARLSLAFRNLFLLRMSFGKTANIPRPGLGFMLSEVGCRC